MLGGENPQGGEGETQLHVRLTHRLVDLRERIDDVHQHILLRGE